MGKLHLSVGTVQEEKSWDKQKPLHDSLVRLMQLPFVFLLFIFFLAATSIQGQTLPKRYSLPGFIQLNDTLFIAETETDIKEYGRFLMVWNHMSGDTGFLAKALPSPIYLGWTYWDPVRQVVLMYADEYTFEENQNTTASAPTSITFTPLMSDWPVVNITKQQANLYCDFRTKDYAFFQSGLRKKDKSKYPPNLVFRLPTVTEWVGAATSSLDTTKYKYGVVPGASMLQNDSLIVSAKVFIRDSVLQAHPFSVKTRHQNNLGIYNMCGNVAEFVTDSEYVYGGSFNDPVQSCTVTSKELFDVPKNNVGFRVVAVIRME